MKLYTQRQSARHERFVYDIPMNVRSRITHTLQQHREPWQTGTHFDFLGMLEEVRQQLLKRKGSLQIPQQKFMAVSEHPVINHFFLCSDNEALDFIELCFQTRTMGGDCEGAKMAVIEINRIFEEESVGYELTLPSTTDLGPGKLFGRTSEGIRSIRIEYPKIIKKDDQVIHENAIKPALESLRQPHFAIANGELLTAFEKMKNGDYPDAITSCGVAFESVLKSICTAKGWSYDPDKDTTAKLIGICKDNGLFFPFYSPILEGVGTLRNKLGDAHGKGPNPLHVAGREHAENMIAVSCAHIRLIVRLADLSK